MKNLFTLTALLMVHLTYTQNIKPTKEQENRIKEIFTPDYIIESSKPISIVSEQDSVITVRDKQIKELEAKVEALKKEHVKTLVNIAKENKIAKDASEEVDDITDSILKLEKLKWSGLHFYGGIEAEEADLQRLRFNTELIYTMNKINFGAKLESYSTDEKTQFRYLLKANYKFF